MLALFLNEITEKERNPASRFCLFNVLCHHDVFTNSIYFDISKKVFSTFIAQNSPITSSTCSSRSKSDSNFVNIVQEIKVSKNYRPNSVLYSYYASQILLVEHYTRQIPLVEHYTNKRM